MEQLNSEQRISIGLHPEVRHELEERQRQEQELFMQQETPMRQEYIQGSIGAAVDGRDLQLLNESKGWYREEKHGREVEVSDIAVQPAQTEGKYKMSAVIDGQVISHEISQKDYDKFLAVDDYHRMKLFSKIFNEVVKDGDIVSVDCGTYMNGFCGDSAYTFCVGEVDEEIRNLLKVTKEALYIGIQNAVQGKRIGDIGYAIQQYCESHSYGVVREFVGHGIGKEMHEDPQVPNYGKRGYGPLMKRGLCIAIEPMITLGDRQVIMERDGWTVRTRDRKCAAHFEHTIAVGAGEADILSSFKFIEEVLGDKAI